MNPKIEDYFDKFEKKFNLRFSDQQKEIVRRAIEEKCYITTIGRIPGKWILNHLIYLYGWYKTDSFDKIFAIYKYFYVVYELPTNGKKTGTYYICNVGANNIIGEIKWWSGWRKFCYFPYEDTVWDSKCLNDITNLLESINI